MKGKSPGSPISRAVKKEEPGVTQAWVTQACLTCLTLLTHLSYLAGQYFIDERRSSIEHPIVSANFG